MSDEKKISFTPSKNMILKTRSCTGCVEVFQGQKSAVSIASEVAAILEKNNLLSNVVIPDGYDDTDSSGGSTTDPTQPSTPVIDQNSWTHLVLIVAGQSNAVGYDESAITNDDIAQMSDRALQLGFKGDNNLKYVQLQPCAENFQDMTSYGNPNSLSGYSGTKGIALPLAYELLQHLPSDKKVIIIPAAYGGTGFDSSFVLGTYDETTMKPSSNNTRWGSDSPFYKAVRDRLKFVLDDTTIKAKFGGVVWCLGEHDGQKGKYVSWHQGFKPMVEQFATDFASYADKSIYGKMDKSTWFVYETVGYWYKTSTNYIICQMIWQEYRNWLGERNYTYITRSAKDNSDANGGTGKTSSTRGTHFGGSEFRLTVAPEVSKILTASAPSFYTNADTYPANNTALEHLTFDNQGLQMIDSTCGLTLDEYRAVQVQSVTVGDVKTVIRNSVLFGKDYKIVMFTPNSIGIWAILATNDYTSLSDSILGIVGVNAGYFGQKASLNYAQGKVTVFQTSTASQKTEALDVFFMVKGSDTSNVLWAYKANTGTMLKYTTVANSVYTAKSLNNWQFGMCYAVSSGKDTTYSSEHPNRAMTKPVGIKDPVGAGLVADLANVTDAELLAIANLYMKMY